MIVNKSYVHLMMSSAKQIIKTIYQRMFCHLLLLTHSAKHKNLNFNLDALLFKTLIIRTTVDM